MQQANSGHKLCYGEPVAGTEGMKCSWSIEYEGKNLWTEKGFGKFWIN